MNAGRPATAGRWLVAASLLLLAANLRPLFSSTAVLLPDIRLNLGLSAAAVGYLTTLPVLCMGLFAPLAPRCAQRIGVERTLLLVLLLIMIGTALRGVLGSTGLFLGTALGGAGIALGNVLLPSLVKRDFSDRAWWAAPPWGRPAPCRWRICCPDTGPGVWPSGPSRRCSRCWPGRPSPGRPAPAGRAADRASCRSRGCAATAWPGP
jgi:hypothetical protein